MGQVRKMSEQEMFDKVTERSKELMELPEVQKEMMKIYHAEGKAKAEEWVYYQALITLLYSPEERAEMVKAKAA